MKQLVIYTDGGCWPNPGGKGGYGSVIIDGGEVVNELWAGYKHTTNNRMEIMGAIAALESLKMPSNVVIYSDSQYLVKTMNGQFRQGANKDLWIRLTQAKKRHFVIWKWVRGHNGNEWNERCDALASHGADQDDLLEDEGYEKATV